ncbi:MAG TPA: hypothetical protein VMB05_14550 [Solirubrobacteraceae bacterium]|nr:hypothetical protein [Solirubrobacteraceae bacterium]
MSASAVVARAEDAVHEADEGKVPPSAEVEAQGRIDSHENEKAAAATAAKVGAKPSKAKAKAAEKKEPKYGDEIREVTKKARGFRGKDNAVAPVTVQRVEALLTKAKMKPADVIGAFKSKKDATAFAGGDKEVKTPVLVKELGEKTSDPFARGRGLVAISLALAGK